MIDYESKISKRAASLRPSAIRRFFDLMENIDDAISLGIGEPDYVTPWHIREAGIYSLEKGFTKYTPNAGLSDLRRAIADYQKRRFGLSYAPKGEIFVTVGGSEGIDLALRALLDPGDEVIIPQPSFLCYGPMTTMAGGVPVIVETKMEHEFRLTPEELEAAITPKTKVVILPYPCNPTGAILEREDLEALAQVILRHDLVALTDEIYAELTYTGKRHVSMASIPEMWERTVVVNGFSKSYAMTGWRMGYICAPRELISQMIKIHQYAIMSAPTTSQYAAIEALDHGDRDIVMMREDYNRRRRLLVDGLREMGLSCFEPTGAFYAFPCIKSTGLTSSEFCEQLLLSQRVAAIPGTAFGESGEGYVRMCYATSVKELTEALARMKRFLEEL